MTSSDKRPPAVLPGRPPSNWPPSRRQTVVFCFETDWSDELVASGVCGAIAGCQGQDLYRAEKKLTPFEEIIWLGASREALSEGEILGDCMNLTRRLINEPPSVMTPIRFAQEATELAQQYGLEIDVWDEERLEQERCGALLAVARGSAHPPRLVTLKYRGTPGRHRSRWGWSARASRSIPAAIRSNQATP